MRKPNALLRERLLQLLRANPRRSSTDLAKTLGVTSQSVRRLLAELPERAVVSAGQTRRVRYALRRPLRGAAEDLPVYSVDAQGRAQPFASLALLQPEGTLLPLEGTPWPTPDESRDGWCDGLPYPIFAIRPQGYLGRQFARAEHRDLDVADDPDQWSDDDIVWVLSRRGEDVPGNLVLGNESYQRWLDAKIDPPAPLSASGAARAYADRAQRAVASAGGGSSAAGEFPKFTALRALPRAATPQVLVKFSGAARSAAERRWGDLLVCEHHALESAARLPGVAAARSRILTHAGRVFIEVERFDRIGPHGRSPVVAMDALHATFLGTRSMAWPDLVRSLAGLGLLDAAGVGAVEHLWWFGRLIANSDMHLGNLSFHVEGAFRLAPAYDMLPMAYAPLAGGEVPLREFAPALPVPSERAPWLAACAIATEFWTEAASDSRISAAFRAICRANAARLRELADKV